ncbi:hypothetical protein K0M31_007436, partial [Melipona bicolor]
MSRDEPVSRSSRRSMAEGNCVRSANFLVFPGRKDTQALDQHSGPSIEDSSTVTYDKEDPRFLPFVDPVRSQFATTLDLRGLQTCLVEKRRLSPTVLECFIDSFFLPPRGQASCRESLILTIVRARPA